MQKHPATLGGCVDDALKRVTEVWYSEFGGMRSREEAFIEGITSIAASLFKIRGDRAEVNVVLAAKKKSENISDHHVYLRGYGGARGWVHVTNPEL